MKLAKKLLATTMACATAFGMTACGGGASLELDYDYTESDKKIEYTFFSTNWQDFEGAKEDRILKHIEEKFNVDIKITGAGSNWQDRLSTEIADNNTPDLFFALPDTSTITNYIKKQVSIKYGYTQPFHRGESLVLCLFPLRHRERGSTQTTLFHSLQDLVALRHNRSLMLPRGNG